MTLKQIRSHVRSQLARLAQDEREAGAQSQFTDAEVDNFINEASRIFCEETGILSTSGTVAISAGVGTLPTGFLAVKRIEIDSEPIGRMNRLSFNEDLPV